MAGRFVKPENESLHFPARGPVGIEERDRLRPVLMTMGTAILGMVPLCIGVVQIGGDGPPYFPMARAIVGGLVFSTLVTLLALPVIYSLLDDGRIWLRTVVRDGLAGRVLRHRDPKPL